VLKQESTQTQVSSNVINFMEKEKDFALSDLRRIMSEKEVLKEKLKVSNTNDIFFNGNLLRKNIFLCMFSYEVAI
jgi:centrosomal protein CEP135